MVHPAPAAKTRNERRRAFIERTGAIMDCDPTDADKLPSSTWDEPIGAEYDRPMEE